MSIRVSTDIIGNEGVIKLLKGLHVQGEYSYHEISNNKKYGTPLPDKSVDCFIYHQEKGYVDVPFMVGKQIYQSIFPRGNINQLMEKSKIDVQFLSTLRDYQVPLVEQCEEMLEKNDCVLLHARPGCGKTLMSIYLSSRLGFTTLVVVNRRALVNQWRQSVENHSNGKVWVYGEKVPDYKVNFIITMVDGLNKIGTEFLDRIGTVILDEAHMLMTPKQVPAILRLKPVKLILCTATPDRDERTTTIIGSFVSHCRVVKRYDGYLKIIKFRTNIFLEEKRLKRGGGLDWTDYVKKQQVHEGRNQLVVEWVKKNPGRKILIMTWGKDHAPHLCSLIQQDEDLQIKEVTADWMANTKKKYKDGNVLIGSFGKIGVGHDPGGNDDWDGVHYDLAIFLGTTQSLALLEQLWGRAFRSQFPHVVVFLDDNKKADDHWRKMNKIAKLYQAEVIETQEILTITSPSSN